ncbi:hypothetical protein MMC07_007096 [Pseudocyphellaria aurata]|nr:hypothetical protein [Pseudocyphellaria aurata]
MDDVIESCQVTFEEDGVNQHTLEDLRKTWQTKLTALHVASFPWEPPPVPQPMPNPATVPSNVPPAAQSSPSAPQPLPMSSGSVPSSATGGVRIKAEPASYDHQGLGQTNGIPAYGSRIAQERAAQNLQQKFGANANLQINQLQAQTAMTGPSPQQPKGLQNIQLPPQMTDQKRQHQSRQYQNVQQAQQRPSISSAQTDGADDWNVMVTQRRAEAMRDLAGSVNADVTLKQQIRHMSLEMEGGGFMMPLSERSKPPPLKKPKNASSKVEESSSASLVAAQLERAPKVAQLDGLDESEDEVIKDDPDQENDEDAINSDLDDPDENVVDEGDEDAQQGQIMLCTYDKVQRVKNKWKCTLKDGVLTTGGKE